MADIISQEEMDKLLEIVDERNMDTDNGLLNRLYDVENEINDIKYKISNVKIQGSVDTPEVCCNYEYAKIILESLKYIEDNLSLIHNKLENKLKGK